MTASQANPKIILASPVSLGERLVIPVVRMFFLFREEIGLTCCTPVALLIRESNIWYFVILEEGIDQDILNEVKPLLPPETP